MKMTAGPNSVSLVTHADLNKPPAVKVLSAIICGFFIANAEMMGI